MVGSDENDGRSYDAFNGASIGDRHKAANRPLGVLGVIGSTEVMVKKLLIVQ